MSSRPFEDHDGSCWRDTWRRPRYCLGRPRRLRGGDSSRVPEVQSLDAIWEASRCLKRLLSAPRNITIPTYDQEAPRDFGCVRDSTHEGLCEAQDPLVMNRLRVFERTQRCRMTGDLDIRGSGRIQ